MDKRTLKLVGSFLKAHPEAFLNFIGCKNINRYDGQAMIKRFNRDINATEKWALPSTGDNNE